MILLEVGDLYIAEFAVTAPATGAMTDADSTPTVAARTNGVADATFAAAMTVTKVATGYYEVKGTVPTMTTGDEVRPRIAYAVGGVSLVMPLEGARIVEFQSEAYTDVQVTRLRTGGIDLYTFAPRKNGQPFAAYSLNVTIKSNKNGTVIANNTAATIFKDDTLRWYLETSTLLAAGEQFRVDWSLVETLGADPVSGPVVYGAGVA